MSYLAPEEARAGEQASVITVDRLAEVLIEITNTLVDDVDPIAFLQHVTTRVALMSHSLWAGVVLADTEGQLRLATASTESAELKGLFELGKAEGPWLDCFRTGSPAVNIDLTQAEDRWPVLVPRAITAGFRSVSAFPLRRRRIIIGALILFSSNPEHLEPQGVRIMQALVDVTTIGLLNDRSPHDDVLRVAAFQSSSPRSRTDGERVKGAVARTRGVSTNAVSDLIEGYAHRTPQRPDQAAEAVLANPALSETKEPHALLTPAEVAAMFRVDPKTITRWAKTGQLTAVRTLGGHRRYRSAEVTRLLREG